MFNESHFGSPPSPIYRLTSWVAKSRMLWCMRTAPICTEASRNVYFYIKSAKINSIPTAFLAFWVAPHNSMLHPWILGRAPPPLPPPPLISKKRVIGWHTGRLEAACSWLNTRVFSTAKKLKLVKNIIPSISIFKNVLEQSAPRPPSTQTIRRGQSPRCDLFAITSFLEHQLPRPNLLNPEYSLWRVSIRGNYASQWPVEAMENKIGHIDNFTSHTPNKLSDELGKLWTVRLRINTKNYWKQKTRLCVRWLGVINLTWENLQIAKHKSGRCSFSSAD